MMRSFLLLGFMVASVASPRGVWFAAKVVQEHEQQQRESTRFAAVDLFIDSGETPLAAWQVELKATRGTVRIVGIENGEHAAFSEAPPYYDPDAMMNDRVILAQYSLARAEHLPTGRTRIATVHVQVEGDVEPEFTITLLAAGDPSGQRIDAEPYFEMRTE